MKPLAIVIASLIACAGGVVVGFGITAAASGQTSVSETSSVVTPAPGESAPLNPFAGKPYGVNASGQTYGSGLSATSIDTEPDLIAATATNGVDGYVRKQDVDPPADLHSPADNLAYSERSLKGRTIDVYAEDGKTVVGTFQVGGPESTAAPTPGQ